MTIHVTPIPRLSDFAVPALTLGTANAAGATNTVLATDATLLAFDATLPDAITFGQSGAAGSAVVTSRRDHAHAMAALDVPLTAIDIDGGTDIGEALVDADLFIVDNGAGGTNRKTAASRLKTYIGEQAIARKTSDESVTSNTTMQDDDALKFDIGASEVWFVTCTGFVSGMDTGGMKVSWGLPSGGTYISNTLFGGGVTGSASASVFAQGQTEAISPGQFVGTGVLASLAGFTNTAYIVNDTTAGEVVFKWAQNSSNGTATTLLAGSTLVAQRIV